MSIPAVKASLHRGRARLRELGAGARRSRRCRCLAEPRALAARRLCGSLQRARFRRRARHAGRRGAARTGQQGAAQRPQRGLALFHQLFQGRRLAPCCRASSTGARRCWCAIRPIRRRGPPISSCCGWVGEQRHRRSATSATRAMRWRTPSSSRWKLLTPPAAARAWPSRASCRARGRACRTVRRSRPA